MKIRFFFTLLCCTIALSATTPPALAGDKSDQKQPDKWPQVLSRVEPRYPANLLAQKVEGEVTLTFVVNQQGQVTDVRALSTEHPEFAAAASEALKQWTFTPGMKDGRAVKTEITQPFRFELPAKQR